MITYLGLSHLSLCYAASALKKGYRVNIFDFEKSINLFKNKKNIFENNLDKILLKYRNNLSITSNFNKIKSSKIIFLAQDLETDRLNKPNQIKIKKLIKKIHRYKNKKVLVVMSQVPVTFCRKLNWNKKNLYHFVETLIFGQGVKRAMNPERIVLGKNSSGQKIHPGLRRFLMAYRCPLIEMTYEESELTKAYINIFLASQLTTTNYLNELSQKFGADWSKIKAALVLDKRISKYSYLNPGLGISGGNIERDLVSIGLIKKRNKLDYSLINKFISISNKNKSWPFLKIKKFLKKKTVVGILGFTYKENTISYKNSPSIVAISKIKKSRCIIHDAKSNLLDCKNKYKFVNLNEVLLRSNAIIIFHKNTQYKKIKFSKYSNIKAIVDPFKIVDKKNLNIKKQKYFNL